MFEGIVIGMLVFAAVLYLALRFSRTVSSTEPTRTECGCGCEGCPNSAGTTECPHDGPDVNSLGGTH
jgi:hypothetical protein